jgi:hypothetical protein
MPPRLPCAQGYCCLLLLFLLLLGLLLLFLPLVVPACSAGSL